MLRAIVSGSRGAARFAARARLYTNHGAESGSGMRATTILCVRHEGEVAVVGDGQVSMGSQVMKPNAVKVRRIGTDDEPILTGFAGATADCFTLRERLERKIEEHPGQLTRACVELAKNWRMDKYLRRLDAVLLVANKDVSLTVTGNGDVIEPHDGIIAIGSGGSFALAAARALIDQPGLSAMDIARKSMNIAADMCVYTNHNFVEDTIPSESATRIDDDADGDKESD